MVRSVRILCLLIALLAFAGGLRAQVAHAAPIITVQSRTGSFDGSACNARTTYLLATDTSAAAVGFAGATTASATNMQQIVWSPPHAMNVLPTAVQVIDSMQDGEIALRIVSNDSSVTLDTVRYCTIADTLAPMVSFYLGPDTCACYAISAAERRPWDRGVDSLWVTNSTNVVIDTIRYFDNTLAQIWLHPGQAGWPGLQICIGAKDSAGNRRDTCFAIPDFILVGAPALRIADLRIYPNPSSDYFTIDAGAETAPLQVEVLDVLGRAVAHVQVAGTATFDARVLPAGAYLMRVGGQLRRIVKE